VILNIESIFRKEWNVIPLHWLLRTLFELKSVLTSLIAVPGTGCTKKVPRTLLLTCTEIKYAKVLEKRSIVRTHRLYSLNVFICSGRIAVVNKLIITTKTFFTFPTRYFEFACQEKSN